MRIFDLVDIPYEADRPARYTEDLEAKAAYKHNVRMAAFRQAAKVLRKHRPFTPELGKLAEAIIALEPKYEGP